MACDLRAPDPAARPALPASARFALADVTDPAALSRLAGEQPTGAIVHLAGVTVHRWRVIACALEAPPR